MTLPYTTQAGKLAFQEATALWRTINFRAADFKALRGLNADLKQLKSISTGARAAANPISSSYKKLEFDIQGTTKKLTGIQKITDALKKGLFKQINPQLASSVNLWLSVASVGLTVLAIKANEEVQAYNIETQKFTEAGVSDAFTRSINNSIQLKGQAKQIEALKVSDQKTRDRVYAVEKESITFRQKINDITYEVRQGRKIIEEKISAEIQKANTRIAEINIRVNNVLGNTTNNAIDLLKNTITKLQDSLSQSNRNIERLSTRVEKAETVTKAIPSVIQRTVTISQDTTKKAVDSAFDTLQQVNKRWGVTVTPSTITPAQVTVSESLGLSVTPATVTPARVTFSDFSTSDLGLQLKVNQERQQSNINSQLSALGSAVSNVGTTANNAQQTANRALQDANKRVLDPRVDDLYTKLREREQVDREANRKLDEILPKINSILPTIAGIPLIAGRAADLIRPDIPTISGIESATGRAMCRNLQTGCGRQAIDDAVGNINQHNTSNTGSVLDALNTGANAALLQGQQTILSRLGDQLPGGLSGKLERFSKWLHLDRALNMMIWATTIHNALMLSSDIGQTLLGIISNVLQLFGLKDSEGNAFDLGSIISSSIENLIKGMIGADNYTQLRETWAKANRIYQATINIFNAVQGLLSTILNALEITAGRVGKIGNALRRSGEILENSYSWMNPQPKFNRVTQFLETLQNGASTVQMVTQAPLDVVNAITETTNAATEFTTALKEDGNTNNQGSDDKEPEQLTAVAAASKLASAGQEMTEQTLEPDEVTP